MTNSNTTEFLEGDLVEAVKGEERHTARLTFNSFVKGLILGAPGGSLDWFTKEGFTLTLIERPKPKVELPTEPALYTDREGDVWILTGDPKWQLLTEGGGEHRAVDWVSKTYEERVAEHAPFTRLESRADTAKAIVAEVEKRTADLPFGTLSAMTVLHGVASEFGVNA